MSGPLSILREVLAIFYPGRFPIADIYGHLVVIAFVASALLLLMIKLREVVDLERQLDKSKPNFNADFDVFCTAPAGTNDKDSIALITAHITNSGAPSILKNIGVLVQVGDRIAIGQPVPLHQEGWHFKGEVDGQTVDYTAGRDDYLVRKCYSQPVVTGGGVAGAHLVLLRGIRGMKFILLTQLSFYPSKILWGKNMNPKRQ